MIIILTLTIVWSIGALAEDFTEYRKESLLAQLEIKFKESRADSDWKFREMKDDSDRKFKEMKDDNERSLQYMKKKMECPQKRFRFLSVCTRSYGGIFRTFDLVSLV